MTLATRLTVLRMVLVPAGIALLYLAPSPWRFTGALAVFIIAAATDWADGRIARARGQTSTLGAFLDPLADKLLVLTFFVFLTVLGAYPMLLLLCMLVRELVHDGFRNFIASRGRVVGANMWSKWKAALQMLSMCVTLGSLALASDLGIARQDAWIGLAAGGILMTAALVSGVVGTIVFFRGHASALR